MIEAKRTMTALGAERHDTEAPERPTIDNRGSEYRGRAGALGDAYYSLASTLNGAEAGNYGAVDKRALRRLKAAMVRARRAFDAAAAAIEAARIASRDL
jgi:hypothetical protein